MLSAVIMKLYLLTFFFFCNIMLQKLMTSATISELMYVCDQYMLEFNCPLCRKKGNSLLPLLAIGSGEDSDKGLDEDEKEYRLLYILLLLLLLLLFVIIIIVIIIYITITIIIIFWVFIFILFLF
jgi:hypothetical protein